MKTVLLALFLVAQAAQAAVSIKLDLDLEFRAIGFREVNGGQWLAGVGKQLAHLEKDGRKRLALSYFQAWNAEAGNPAYGLSLGAPFSSVSEPLGALFDRLLPELPPKVPPFLKRMGDLISLDAYVGYRPRRGPDLAYGVGGYLRVPLSLKEGP